MPYPVIVDVFIQGGDAELESLLAEHFPAHHHQTAVEIGSVLEQGGGAQDAAAQLQVLRQLNDLRAEVLSIVKAASPQSFPQDRAYIRVKIDGGMNVTLVGWADPGDKLRLEAAVVQINSLPLVKDVENQVVFQKIG